MSIVTELFTEKFRPKALETLIAPMRVKSELSRGLVQNLLLYSNSPGTGKTTSLFILSAPYTSLYINASSEGRIDLIRERITKFCSTISLEGGSEKLKCVILDEFDGASTDFYLGIRAVMEKFAHVTRFIASCNYIQKIPEPVQSRFNCISYDPINSDEETYIFDEYVKRIGKILTATTISYTPELLNKFIKNDFPDMRAILNKVQSFYLQGIHQLDERNFNINFDFEDLYKLCLTGNEPYENYKLITSEYASKIDDTLMALSYDFVEYIKVNAPNKIDLIPMVIITVCEYQAQRLQVIDASITLLACVYKLQQILNKK
jgi:replication factor C small subunit